MIESMTMRHATLPTGLGDLTAVVDTSAAGTVLVGLYFPGHWTLPQGADHGPEVTLADEPLLAHLTEQLEEYLGGGRRAFDIPYALRGGEHHREVWRLLERIPYGRTTTYGEIAAQTGGAAQAVGRAVGANPISVLVPCHRVVGSDGSLTGYAGGLERKRRLLDLERPPAAERDALF